MRKPAAIAILICAFALIAGATLFPSDDNIYTIPRYCIFCGDYGGVDFTLNTILFIPYGIGLLLVLERPWRAIGLAAATSFGIELAQFLLIPGRDASIGDLLANTLGAAIGVLLARFWRTWLLPAPEIAARFSTIAIIVWMGLLMFSGWLLQPAPTPSVWYAQAIPALAQFETFRGTLLSASVAGEPLPSGTFDPSSPVYAEFGSGQTSVMAAVHAPVNHAPQRIAPIVSIFDARQREIMVLGQEGRSLVFRTRTQASALRFREPAIGLPAVFPVHPSSGDTLVLEAKRTPDGIYLGAEAPGKVDAMMYPFHVFMFWNNILPFNATLTLSQDIWSLVWAFALLLLPAYWFGWMEHARMPLWCAAFLVIPAASLFGLPIILGFLPTPWFGWVGSALGALVGWGSALGVRGKIRKG